jgi:DNA-directed RNA polymerase specialized sigma24 family protein
MRISLDFTQESFDALLDWLDSDRKQAAGMYELTREGLIRIFRTNGVDDGESWADEVISRVACKLPEQYAGEKARYFHGFARNILYEAWRQKEIPSDEFPDQRTELREPDNTRECLRRCMSFLPRDNSEFILDYYVYRGHDKAANHRLMCEELGIKDGALRSKAFQIKTGLYRCIQECLKNLDRQQKHNQKHS